MNDLFASPLTVADWITTAFEGGSNYWIDNVEYLHPKVAVKLSKKNEYPVYSLNEYWESGSQMGINTVDEDEIIIDYNILSQAINNDCISPEVRTRLLTGQYDADDADIVLQVACFGEIVYG